ncbi:hypothetical protein F2P81_013419 [Scophthalmus maximus]|uniref:Uncharacterized protein n=1 Tax=Scophthalmus maximus TaxID=52904 RepID=A0A6A4SGT5_SCOMX|nr:hypothetical protein F2P81_013419 [Scophthalmus maximus]
MYRYSCTSRPFLFVIMKMMPTTERGRQGNVCLRAQQTTRIDEEPIPEQLPKQTNRLERSRSLSLSRVEEKQGPHSSFPHSQHPCGNSPDVYKSHQKVITDLISVGVLGSSICGMFPVLMMRPSDLQTFSRMTFRPSDLQTVSLKTFRPSDLPSKDLQTFRPPDLQSKDLQTFRPPDLQSNDLQTFRPSV